MAYANSTKFLSESGVYERKVYDFLNDVNRLSYTDIIVQIYIYIHYEYFVLSMFFTRKI